MSIMRLVYAVMQETTYKILEEYKIKTGISQNVSSRKNFVTPNDVSYK